MPPATRRQWRLTARQKTAPPLVHCPRRRGPQDCPFRRVRPGEALPTRAGPADLLGIVTLVWFRIAHARGARRGCGQRQRPRGAPSRRRRRPKAQGWVAGASPSLAMTGGAAAGKPVPRVPLQGKWPLPDMAAGQAPPVLRSCRRLGLQAAAAAGKAGHGRVWDRCAGSAGRTGPQGRCNRRAAGR